jgi:hypothetical protein
LAFTWCCHIDIKELAPMPLTDFWNLWRQKQLQPYAGASQSQSLRKTEQQRASAERQAAEQINLLLMGRIEDLEAQRQNGPRGTIAHEDSDRRTEG